MIYSNYPVTISPMRTRHNSDHINAKIILGDDGIRGNYLEILCLDDVRIEKGLNPNLSFEFTKNSCLAIRKHEEDWRNFDDPCWNIPNNLFLMLTSNLLVDKRTLCEYKKGMLKTLEQDSLTSFRMYARVNYSVKRNILWTFGIYKVLTKKPCIIKIIPPGSVPCRFLIINDTQVSEYSEKDECLRSALNSINISLNDILKEDWVTL